MENKMMDIEGRVKRYWYSDGIAELASGGLLLILGLYFGVQGYVGSSSLVSAILQSSLVFIMIGGFFGVSWVINALKTRFTYPRTGYVEYRVDNQNANTRRYVVIAVAFSIAVASMVLIKYIQGLDSMVLVTSVWAGVIFVSLRGKSSGATRFYALGVLSILLGVGLSMSRLSEEYNLALFYGLVGLAVMISGGLVLRRYLNENPLPVGEDNE